MNWSRNSGYSSARSRPVVASEERLCEADSVTTDVTNQSAGCEALLPSVPVSVSWTEKRGLDLPEVFVKRRLRDTEFVG
ncbi:hypothetical protein GCM10009067_11770 [Haloarcula sebkhae]|uniref:Uncharacterized protein n=1 Tax=Haloarcula sebkhae TaxID=932660 RepID=A0A830EXH9_9EURY|nr:hypothetical protein GCM10009067_11770 [Haloarcula sebkhae]